MLIKCYIAEARLFTLEDSAHCIDAAVISDEQLIRLVPLLQQEQNLI
jgi:hypothetical protein